VIRLQCVLVVVVGWLAGTSASAEGVDARIVLSESLGMSAADAATYWDGVSWTVASLVADGRRVAFDGLGAFAPAYENAADGSVRRTMRFTFDLGPATGQPCVQTVFEDELAEILGGFGWLKATGGTVARRLQGEEWQRLLDAFVFCVLRNVDGHSRQPLGLGLGHFYPTVDVDLSTERDANQRRLVVDFFADDDSPEKFAWQYAISVDALEKMVAVLEREAKNLARFARVTGIKEYAEAETVLRAVAAQWQEELDDLGGSKAQDHNSSRSNKTASIIADGVEDLGGAGDAIKAAAAQDHNSSRSNKTASAVDNVGDGGAWMSEVLAAPAQDHNSSRSNKTASKRADFYNDLVSRYDGAHSTKAQDHNSSRSNKTASVVADFEPGPELERLFAGATF
jgi:hypothetical protein